MKKYLNQDPSKFPIIIDIKSLSFSSSLVFCPFPSSVPDIKSLYTLNKYHNILPLYSGCPAKVNIFLFARSESFKLFDSKTGASSIEKTDSTPLIFISLLLMFFRFLVIVTLIRILYFLILYILYHYKLLFYLVVI